MLKIKASLGKVKKVKTTLAFGTKESGLSMLCTLFLRLHINNKYRIKRG